jgi:phosphatidylethanolamine-binding protein (PEBP) family uncharacterized protein
MTLAKLATAAPARPPAHTAIISASLPSTKKLDLKSGAKRAALDRALHGHVVARGEMMAHCSH